MMLGVFVASASLPLLKAQEPVATWHAEGANGAVAAGGRAAAQAGVTILEQGGNAADAAAATIMALGVTDSTLFCLGGEVPIMIYDARCGIVEVIAGQGAAPRLATVEFFRNRPEGIPATGLLSATVPAAIDAVVVLLERHGTKRFAEITAPTLKLLETASEPWHKDLLSTISAMCAAESAHADRRIGLRAVSDYFYRGPVAREIDRYSKEQGGLLRYEDLAVHHTPVEQPIRLNYRDHEILKCGIWTQGPALLEALQILEGFDMKGIEPGSAEAIHLQAEALKLAFADRDEYYADPNFADVPTMAELLDPEYAAARRTLIDRDKASIQRIPGDPKGKKARKGGKALAAGPGGPSYDTTTCLAADAAGNIVAATPSGWSGVVAGKSGIWLGTRLQSFTLDPESPNVLVPGKRPRITLTPTLILKDGKAIGGVSVAGGDSQDQSAIQIVTSLIDFGLTPKQAIEVGRFHTDHLIGSFRQKPPRLGSLILEKAVSDEAAASLLLKGHLVERSNKPQSNPIVLTRDPKSGLIQAAGDPNSRRNAVAY
jgi:gamma-glutamyltranspeptidase/glutathione hydrolase